MPILNGNGYAVHQLIWTLFPGRPGADRTFLFRQEFEKEQLSAVTSVRGIPLFYVLSKDKPSTQTDILVTETKEYAPKLLAGDKLAFSLRANPVIARKQNNGKRNSKHCDVLMDVKYHLKHSNAVLSHEQIQVAQNQAVADWLVRKGTTAGFNIPEIDGLQIAAYQQQVLSKRSSVRNDEIKFSSVDISGIIEVTDPVLFLQMLEKGLGSAKSFGCGMMMIRRI
jgi:CRISPR system Cascade subunit CasE